MPPTAAAAPATAAATSICNIPRTTMAPVGRGRHSCDKCNVDHKKCHPVLKGGVVVGCERCLGMPSVASCSLATLSIFQHAKNGGPSSKGGTSTLSSTGCFAAQTDKGKSTLSVCSVDCTTPSTTGGFAAQTDVGKRSLQLSDEDSQTVVESQASAVSVTSHTQTDESDHGGQHFAALSNSYLSTPCRGSAMFFIINPRCPNPIISERHNRRIGFDDIQQSGQYVFLENRTIPNCALRDFNHNNLVVIMMDGKYFLGVVEALRFRALDEHFEAVDGILDAWLWSPEDTSDTDQLSNVLNSPTWTEIQQFFRHVILTLGVDDFDVYFVNQVAGPVWNRGSKFDIRDPIDGGLQCSREGADIFHPPMPKPRQMREILDTQGVTLSPDNPDAEFYHSEDGENIYAMRLLTRRVTNSVRRNLPYVKRFVKFKQVVFNYENSTNYHTISHLDGTNVSNREMRYSDPSINGCVLIASPSSSLNNEDWVTFYALTKQSLVELRQRFHKFSHVRAVALFERAASSLAVKIVKYFVLNMRSNEPCSGIVYSGNSSPGCSSKNVTGQPDLWKEHLDIESDLVHRQLWESAGRFEEHPPISMSYISKYTQSRQFDKYDLRLISKGINNRHGTFPVRSCTQTIGGSNSYFGQRGKRCRTMPSASQGPSNLTQYQLTRQFTNCLYLMYTLKILNSAAEATGASMKNFWKHLHVSSSFKHTGKWICRVHILTIDFYNSPHIDQDSLPEVKDSILDELDSVINCQDRSVEDVFKRQACLSRHFVNDFECAIPTTCCYQLLYKGSNDEPPDPPLSHYYFLNTGLGSCHRIHNHMTSSFCGSVFQHCTSVPLFTQTGDDGLTSIHIAEHDEWTWLAWGAGSPSGGTVNNNQSDREIRYNRRTNREITFSPRNRARAYDNYERNEPARYRVERIGF